MAYFSPTTEDLRNLTRFIHWDNDMWQYHIQHINLVREYAWILTKRLEAHYPLDQLSFIAYAHDLFKERSLDPTKQNVIWHDIQIPQDLNRYVRTNIPILDKFGLGEYFNTDIQLHPLAAGIFLTNRLSRPNKETLYPIFFHSCPIIPVYEQLPEHIRTLVDIIMLADKLSSNYLRINMTKVPVRLDLDLAVFGADGKEFNYTLGLLLARMIAQGKSTETYSVQATEYYYNRLKSMNPFIPKSHAIKRLGGNKLWPQRSSQVLPMQYRFLKT